MRQLAFALSLSAALAAFGAEPEATIQRVHAQFEQAMNTNNYAKAKAIAVQNFTPDFVRTRKAFKSNLQQWLQNMNPPAGVKITSFKFSLGKITTTGNTAKLLSTVTGVAQMKQGDGKMHKIVGTSIDEETWVKVGNAWKLRKMATVKESTTLDGKAVNPG